MGLSTSPSHLQSTKRVKKPHVMRMIRYCEVSSSSTWWDC